MSTATLTRARTFGTDEANELLYGGVGSEIASRWDVSSSTSVFSEYDTGTYETFKDKYSDNEFVTEAIPQAPQATFSQPQTLFTTETPVFESYVTDTASVVEKSKTFSPFKPNLIVEQNDFIQLVDTQIAEPIKIAEVEMEVEHETIAKSTREHKRKVSSESVIKLNHKGMIVVGTFLAVLLLVTVLVIINSVNLNSSASRLSSLRAQNALTSSQLSQAQAERDRLYNERAAELYSQLNSNRNGNSSSVNTGNGNINVEYVGNNADRVQQQQPWRPGGNPDQSSNWFGNLSNWMNSIFR
ncbi:MAG: hypothetical protein FWE01_02530 [Firmicutes bacterium]|nr:hypothetical protein [Bacillota bacterium]